MTAGLPEPLARFRDDDTPLLGPATEPGPHPKVAVRARDLLALRAIRWPAGVRARHVGLWLDDGDAALSLVPPSGWPDLRLLRSRARPDGVWAVLRFAAPVDVAQLLREIAVQAVGGGPDPDGGLRVLRPDDPPPSEELPPDVVVGDGPAEVSDVTGRAPLVVSELDGPLRLGPLDERVLNPHGFRARVDGPEVDVATLDLRDGVTPGLVRSLRSAAGVRIRSWDDVPLVGVAGLAMAGVPLVADAAGPASPELGAGVSAAIGAAVDLADPVAREEHSLVLRRAAFDAFSRPAWRAALAARAGVPVAGMPSVSVLLATRRPEMLDHALAQVARQRGVDRLELVLATHGFEADAGRVRDAVGPGVGVVAAPRPAGEMFGDVLHAATLAASGDVVMKLDDDDWYAPDAVADLLRARAYSGADLVGMPAERHYVEPADTTVVKGHPTEIFARFVAGGTLLIDRGDLLELGGWRPVRKFVDAQLLDAVHSSGGSVYRTHGLGYVLRRTAGGHTWDVSLDELLDPARMLTSLPGFRPSRSMEL